MQFCGNFIADELLSESQILSNEQVHVSDSKEVLREAGKVAGSLGEAYIGTACSDEPLPNNANC
jgi:hypothetical protein